MTDEEQRQLTGEKLIELRQKMKQLKIVRDEMKLWGERLFKLGLHLQNFPVKISSEDRKILESISTLTAILAEHEALYARVAELEELCRDI
jgi:hypothetical protein